MFTLIIGGSASGKSDYAERHVLSLDSAGPRIYIASMEPFGEEAQARIARHHAMRRDRGFETIECYRNLGSVTLPENSNVLLEDLGNLTANELFGGETFSEECGKTIPDRIAADIDKISLNCANLTIVANEVFSGGKDYEGETTTYLYVLARLSKILAERADQVVELVCGLPQVLKNSKESGFPEPVFDLSKKQIGLKESSGSESGFPEPVFDLSKKQIGLKESSGSESGFPEPVFDLSKKQIGLKESSGSESGFSEPVFNLSQKKMGINESGKRESDFSAPEKTGDRNMIFVTGPLFAGKQEYIMRTLGLNEKQFEALAIRDVQNLAAETPMEKLGDLAESLAEKKIVIATEVGGGIIPLDPVERQNREKAGRLACLLAERAETVIRVCCGLPCYLKGR